MYKCQQRGFKPPYSGSLLKERLENLKYHNVFTGFFPSATIFKICLNRKPPPFIKFLLHDSDMPQYGVLDCYHGSYRDVTNIGLESIEQEERVSYAILLSEKHSSIKEKTRSYIHGCSQT